jgi:CMP-N,N'-diacetyllegionaminic acid synthase
MSTLCIIPARGGSQRVPDKNLCEVGGRPLVARAIKTARAARSIDRLVVSSDDPAILALAARYDERLALPRPAELATEHSPAIDYVRHALAVLESAEPARYEVVVIVQPSSPFVAPADIDAVVHLLLDSGASSAVSVVSVPHAWHAARQQRIDAEGRLQPYAEVDAGRVTSQELPPLVVRNSAVYATRRELIDQGRILGDDCRGYLMPADRSLDIDEPLDLAFARFLAEEMCPDVPPNEHQS